MNILCNLVQTKVLNSRVTKEIAIRNARYLFNPTSEELKQEELYLKEICAKGFPSDYQDYLSSTPIFSKVDDFLAFRKFLIVNNHDSITIWTSYHSFI